MLREVLESIVRKENPRVAIKVAACAEELRQVGLDPIGTPAQNKEWAKHELAHGSEAKRSYLAQ